MNVHVERAMLDIMPDGPRRVVDPHDTVDPFPGMLEQRLQGYRLALNIVEIAEGLEDCDINDDMTHDRLSDEMWEAVKVWREAK